MIEERPWYDMTSGNQTPAQASLLGLSQDQSEATRALIGKLAGYNQQYNQAFQDQGRLSRGLDAVIAGTNPSVAQGQLQQGVGQIQQQQLAQASGASGNNAMIARIAAMNNTGAAQAQANQAAAVQRAMEIDQARKIQAQIAGQRAGEAGGMYGSTLSGAVGFASPAVTAAGSERTAEEKDLESSRAFWANLIGAAGRSMAAGAA